MTIHYHGTPITPLPALYQLAGRHFCVSYAAPASAKLVHEIGQSVLLDNGAFSVWQRGIAADWPGFYKWCDPWLEYATTWAVIPDVIEGSEAEQDGLLSQWPHGTRGAPVWHLNESIDRLLGLADKWPKICFGSTSQFAIVLSKAWRERADEAFTALTLRHRHLPWIHMLRGMQCVGRHYPFASVDSTDIARNHNRPQNAPWLMADRWDIVQCPPRFKLKWSFLE